MLTNRLTNTELNDLSRFWEDVIMAVGNGLRAVPGVLERRGGRSLQGASQNRERSFRLRHDTDHGDEDRGRTADSFQLPASSADQGSRGELSASTYDFLPFIAWSV